MKEEIMVEDIERIDEDVRLFTDDELKLNNSSKPRLETEDEFHEILEQEAKKAGIEISEDDGERKAFISDDLIIHLNQHALEGNLFKEWSAAAISFFQPYHSSSHMLSF